LPIVSQQLSNSASSEGWSGGLMPTRQPSDQLHPLPRTWACVAQGVGQESGLGLRTSPPKSALLDGMDGKSKFGPSQKWLQLYDKLLVAPYGRVAQLGEHLLRA